MTTAPSGPRNTTWFADSQSRTKTCICGGSWKGIALGTLLTRLAALGSLSPPGVERDGVSDRRCSCKPGEKILHELHAIGKRRRRALDPYAIGSGKTNAAVLLHEQDQFSRVERRPLHERKRRPLGTRVDLRHAERPCGKPQAMTGDQRLRGLGRGAEPIDELFAQQVELVLRLAARKALVEDESLVDVA